VLDPLSAGSETISDDTRSDRRRFLDTIALALAAAHLGTVAPATM
jgi:hypothetical protein